MRNPRGIQGPLPSLWCGVKGGQRQRVPEATAGARGAPPGTSEPALPPPEGAWGPMGDGLLGLGRVSLDQAPHLTRRGRRFRQVWDPAWGSAPLTSPQVGLGCVPGSQDPCGGCTCPTSVSLSFSGGLEPPAHPTPRPLPEQDFTFMEGN